MIPSNDALIGNPDAMGIERFDASGNFNGSISMTEHGSAVWDARTEARAKMKAAFINQTGAGRRTITTNPTTKRAGLINPLGGPSAIPIILGGITAADTTVAPVLDNFTQPGHLIARITLVPDPATAMLISGEERQVLSQREP